MHNPGRHNLATSVFTACEMFFGLKTGVYRCTFPPRIWELGAMKVTEFWTISSYEHQNVK